MILTPEQILEAVVPALEFHAKRFAAKRKGLEVTKEDKRVVVRGMGGDEQFGNGIVQPTSWVEEELMNTGSRIA